MQRAQAQVPQMPGFEPAPHDPTPVDFTELPLDERLQKALADRQFQRTTPVQSAVFPNVFAGQDLVGCAQTGTGKTAAFLLPLMQRLLEGLTAEEQEQFLGLLARAVRTAQADEPAKTRY